MDGGETRQPCFLVERHRIITRHDDKNRHSILNRQAVASVCVGANNLAAIRNEDTPDAWIAGLSLPRARPGFEDGSLNDLWASVALRQWRGLLVCQHTLRRDGGDQSCCRGN